MTDELLSAARDFYNATVADPAVTIRCQSAASRDAVTAAGERLRLVLLDQRSVFITTDNPQVVAPPAPRAHEVQAEAVDVGLYLVEPGERHAAADALEHSRCVLLQDDNHATEVPDGSS